MGRNFAHGKQPVRARARRHHKRPAGSSAYASPHFDNPWVFKASAIETQRRSRKKMVVFSGAGMSLAGGSKSVHAPFSTQELVVLITKVPS